MPVLSVYLLFNLFLFIMSGYLFVRTTPDLMKKQEYFIFRIFILVFCFYTIANSLWTMQEYDIISLPGWLFNLVCLLSLTAVLSNAMCFFKFAMIYFGYSDKKNNLFEYIPYAIMVILLIISYFNGMVYSISDNKNIVNGPIYIMIPIVSFIYFIIILISSLVKFVRTKSPQSRKNYITILFLVIFLISWIIIDSYLQGVTIIPMAIFSVILVLFTTFQQSSINTDALTQMNNRRKAIEYLTSQLSSVNNDSPLYLYLCDINSFKAINDNFGHLEGDNALIILSNAIKEVVGESVGFAARYGGDEFVIAVRNPGSNYDKDEIIRNIEKLIKDECKKENKPYDITISAGCKICTDPKISVEEYLNEVDALLYEVKKELYK
ncbi:GGDEF domain-containing protein [bacterium]|nr:GGDEF domain-containing protein [bacterium]